MIRRWSTALGAAGLLAQVGCGYLGLELLDAPVREDGGASDASTAPDGGSDAGGSDATVIPAADAATADAAAATDSGQVGMADGGEAGSPEGGLPADAAAGAADAMAGTPCDMSGTFAIKVRLAVTWSGGVISAGSDISQIWARVVAVQAGNNLSGTFQACGFALPDYTLSPAIETYQLAFPNTLFDHLPAYIPSVPVTLSSASAFAVGGSFTFPTLAIQVGAALSNPSSDPWPSASGLPTVDMDADGKPAVTSLYSNTGGYSYQRLDMAGSERADRTYGAARFALNAVGSVTSCMRMTGTSSFPNFDTHIVGCHVVGKSDCTSTERDLLDNSRPTYAPGSATMELLKVAAGATCADVRAALP